MTTVTEMSQAHAARSVLGFIGDPDGVEPGHFVEGLIDAMMHADSGNLDSLRDVFPELGRAVHVYKNDPAGVTKLKEWSKS